MSGTVSESQEKRWDFLNNQIVIRAKSGETFTFKVPSMMQFAAIGCAAAAMRRSLSPDGIGLISTLDRGTADAVWGFAMFEALLVKASVEWPFSKDADGKPVVKAANFGAEHTVEFEEVVALLDDALFQVRSGRVANGSSNTQQAVDGGGNTGAP